MDLDSRQRARAHRQKPREHRHTTVVERVRHAMDEHGVHTGPRGKDLRWSDPTRGGVAIASSSDVAADLAGNPSECV